MLGSVIRRSPTQPGPAAGNASCCSRGRSVISRPSVLAGETWRRLLVRYPPHVPTHCAEQTFYFGARGLRRRLDYAPDVLGSPSPVSHYCFDHSGFGGIVVPTLRRVVGRAPKGPQLSGPTVVSLQLSDVIVS
jgi:hypothetical protein